jgi:cobalt-zinc-cadmium efflux system membrane fusion protein
MSREARAAVPPDLLVRRHRTLGVVALRLGAVGLVGLGLVALGRIAAAAEGVEGWLGVVLPDHSVEVVAEISGTVLDVRVGLGDPVAAGDTVALLDAPAVRADVAISSARLLAAEAEITARAARVEELERVLAQRTGTSQVFSRDEVERVRAELRIGQADLDLARAHAEEARASLVESRRRLDAETLRTPVKGRIARVDVALGERVAAGGFVFRVVDTERVTIRFAVPEEEPVRPTTGDTLRILSGEIETSVLVTAESPVVETEAGCVVYEARALGGSASVSPGAVVRVTRVPRPAPARSVPAAGPSDPDS